LHEFGVEKPFDFFLARSVARALGKRACTAWCYMRYFLHAARVGAGSWIRLQQEDRMTRFTATSVLVLIFFATPALSAELPSRKAGLWEVQTSFENGKIPAQVVRQCVDTATDQMMQSRAANYQQECSKRDVQKSAVSTTIDSTCTVGGKTLTSHAVITGSFDSAYTMTVTSQSEGPPAVSRTLTMAAKWIGPCAADQKPGDMIMANGMKINILDAQKRGPPPGVPQPPQ
jgi:hypothetical protein